MIPFLALAVHKMDYVTLTGFGFEKVTVASVFMDPVGLAWILIVVPILFSSFGNIIKPNSTFSSRLQSVAFLLALYYFASIQVKGSGWFFTDKISADSLSRGLLSPPDSIRRFESTDLCRSFSTIKNVGIGIRTMVKGCTFRITLPHSAK